MYRMPSSDVDLRAAQLNRSSRPRAAHSGALRSAVLRRWVSSAILRFNFGERPSGGVTVTGDPADR